MIFGNVYTLYISIVSKIFVLNETDEYANRNAHGLICHTHTHTSCITRVRYTSRAVWNYFHFISCVISVEFVIENPSSVHTKDYDRWIISRSRKILDDRWTTITLLSSFVYLTMIATFSFEIKSQNFFSNFQFWQ